ncbi:MAG: 2'-5' RNA ligase family protein [Mycobacteriaceae bacterium]|nr:2'-5' RNA ligase family protein [Mycobacteriaceae bacterium]
MVHSIELLFDPDTETAVRRLWSALEAADIPSQAPASRPHVTLVVAERIAAEVEQRLVGVSQRFPLRCVIGAPLLFGRAKAVLARLIVPTTELLAVHAEVHRCCQPYLTPGPIITTMPDQWTAHVTLARRVGGAQLGRALRIAGKPAQLSGTFVGIRRWEGNRRLEHLICSEG